MKIAIVYDSSTGNTKAAAEQMAEMARAAGHECTAVHVQQADPAEVSAADALCIGSWTKGLYFIFQGPTPAIMDFLARMRRLNGTPTAVFATYKLATGKTLDKLASAMKVNGANVTGKFRSKGPNAAPEFESWLASL